MALPEERGPIVFGGKEYQVDSFTFDQLALMLANIQAASSHFAAGRQADGMNAARGVIADAIGVDQAELGATKTDYCEVVETFNRICDVAGLKKFGEAQAVQAAPALAG